MFSMAKKARYSFVHCHFQQGNFKFVVAWHLVSRLWEKAQNIERNMHFRQLFMIFTSKEEENGKFMYWKMLEFH